MDDSNESRSSVRLTSNIMLKSKYQKNPYDYLPIDLLPSYYFDTRMSDRRTKIQNEQYLKRLFYAARIIDE